MRKSRVYSVLHIFFEKMNTHLSYPDDFYIFFEKMYTRLSYPGDKKGAKLTAEELESIASSLDESLLSPLCGLSPASASSPWLSSAVDVLTIAHSAVKRDGSDSLLSWYLDNSLKVLDVCNCMSSKIERLCLRHLDRRIVMKLLSSEGNPSEEEIHQARDLLADSEGEGGGAIEERLRDLAVSIEMLALREKVSPVDRVVCHAVQAVNFLTAFVVGVISSALRSSSGPVICLRIPEEFPWGDFVRAIESTIIVESRGGKERDRKMRVLKELDDVEAHGRHVLEVIDQVVASGGGREIVGRLREAAVGLEKATEALLEGLYQLRDEMKKLLLTVRRIRKEMADDFRASL